MMLVWDFRKGEVSDFSKCAILGRDYIKCDVSVILGRDDIKIVAILGRVILSKCAILGRDFR